MDLQHRYTRLPGLLFGKKMTVFQQQLKVIRVIDDDIVLPRAMHKQNGRLQRSGRHKPFFHQPK
jgi:hypothetical protein